MRPWQFIITTTIIGIASLASGWHPLYLTFYVLLFSLLLSAFLSIWSRRGLAFARTLPGGRMQVGELLDERLRLENRSWLPKLWVQVVDSSTIPNHHAGYVVSMGARKRIDWRVRTMCTRRGRYYIGPVVATTGDPLGLFTRTIPLASQRELLVLPQALPLTRFALLPGAMPGRGRGAQRSLQLTTNVVTVREYAQGDAVSHIHWPTTARLSRLMVKEFDLDPTIDIWLVLDMDITNDIGTEAQSTSEYGVTIAASLGQYLLRADLAVGLLINDGHETSLAMDRGVRQLDRLMEALAVTVPSAARPLSELLTLNEIRFIRNSVIIVITASAEEQWVVQLRQVQRRGVKANVIAINAASFGADWSNDNIAGVVARMGIPLMSVRQGDNIQKILEVGA